MNSEIAIPIIESLRQGIPPANHLRHFTVGRWNEVPSLTAPFTTDRKSVTLVQANYGAGKSHLLRLLRETALEQGYAVSLLSLDSKSGVRFDRLDQIFGTVCRNLEVPGVPEKGVHTLFERFLSPPTGSTPNLKIVNRKCWDENHGFDEDLVYTALRAYAIFKQEYWGNGTQRRAEVCDWLYAADKTKYTPRFVYKQFIEMLNARMTDKRPLSFYTRSDTFNFKNSYICWQALSDLHILADAAGLQGLVLLFDEFEDIITNVTRIDWQEAAFNNLFTFYGRRRFNGLSFYAVTPDFARKCMDRLREKRGCEFNPPDFEVLPRIELQALSIPEFHELANRIAETHGYAFNWRPESTGVRVALDLICTQAASSIPMDRTRRFIRDVVRVLDQHLDDHEATA